MKQKKKKAAKKKKTAAKKVKQAGNPNLKRGKPPKWKKKSKTGIHILPDGSIVSDDDIIAAWPEELGKAIDKFELVEGNIDSIRPEPEPVQTLIPKSIGFGNWNVIDSSGKVVNTHKLTKQEAYGMCGMELSEEDESEDDDGEKKTRDGKAISGGAPETDIAEIGTKAKTETKTETTE